MKTINLIAFHAILDAIVNPTFINMVTVTPVRMNKTGNPFYGKVFKVKKGNYLIGTTYENRVNNNLDKEGKDTDFVAQKSNVGNHVSKVRLVNEKNQNSYLQHERFDNSIIETTYLFEGKEIELSAFERFMPTASNYENQGLDKTVKVMSVTTSNIKTFTANGQTYLIV